MKKSLAKSKNIKLLKFYFGFLMLAGIINFYVPAGTLGSNALFYNFFLIITGGLALIILLLGSVAAARGYNLVFGLVNLMISTSGVLNIAPNNYFKLELSNILFHLIFGNLLIYFSISQKISRFLKKKS